jgi:uncharacterized protein
VAIRTTTGRYIEQWLRGDSSVFDRYFLLSYLVVMASAWRLLTCVEYNSWVTIIFTAFAFAGYCFLYTLPPRLVVLCAEWALARRRTAEWLAVRRIQPTQITYPLAVFFMATVDVLAFTDFLIFRLDGHHVTDGFILNLIFGRGGMEALGADWATKLTFLGVIAAFILLQSLVLASQVAWGRTIVWSRRYITRPRVTVVTVAVVLMLVWQSSMYGFCKLNLYVAVTDASDIMPLYMPVTFGHLAKKLGYDAPHSSVIRLRVSVPRDVTYPLHRIEQAPGHKSYNIVWLLAESWRYDMLDPNIMPATCRFAQEAFDFKQHYSAGNGTRMAVFGMFYGLYGNYWWAFLDKEQEPIMMDVLRSDNYQFCMVTSSNFKYPEFLQTMFAKLPPEVLHDDNPLPTGWQNDRRNVNRLIDFIENRDKSRPFMTFMFFESPHARYHFPPECEIRRPYLNDFNYTTTDVTKVGPLILNRYINSCNHLDTQLDKMVKYLKSAGLMDSTIIVITGDHGEEFMESGRWGHNSDFTDWQSRVPMVLWIPGEKPRTIDRMTSHLDLPATILKQLGVTNPPEDYSLGYDMLSDKEREYTVVSDWYNVACIDKDFRAVFPTEKWRGRQEVMTRAGVKVDEPEKYYQAKRPMLLRMAGEMREFAK